MATRRESSQEDCSWQKHLRSLVFQGHTIPIYQSLEGDLQCFFNLPTASSCPARLARTKGVWPHVR
eukprot:1913558-Amphidinium_carterae.1